LKEISPTHFIEDGILNKNSNTLGLPSACPGRPKETQTMETPSNSAKQEQSCDRLKVSDVIRNYKAVTRFCGNYSFDDLKTEGPISCNWQVQPETAGISIHGLLLGTMNMECGRCLETYPVPINIKIDERYVFGSYVELQEKEKELQSEDFYEIVEEEGELDLKDLVHQFLILESENQSTCGRPECRFA
jgi:hypothetical protein